MQNTLLGYIWTHSRRAQIALLVLTLISFPFLYLSLELPKIIVNQAIGGEGPDGEPTDTFTVLGIGFTQGEFLVATAMAFLVLVLINGAFKYRINTAKGILAERLLRRLRTTLLDRVLHFPLRRAKKFNSGELVAMVTAETEPLGGYFGDAIVLPLFQGGTLLTIVIFMFAQNWIMGLAALTMVPVQGYLVPKLQAKINRLAVQRVKTVRQLSSSINSVSGSLEDIHANGGSLWVRASLSELLARIFVIRYQIYRWKFLMKFINNFLNQVTPFFFYLIGGFLVIKGELTLGALVAALTAYKDLTAPWKELLNYYQRRADAKLKYEQLKEAFEGDLETDAHTADAPNGAAQPEAEQALKGVEGPFLPPNLQGDVRLREVSVIDEHGTVFLNSAKAMIPRGCRVLIHGGTSVVRETLAQVLARLLIPTSGTISVHPSQGDPIDLSKLPRSFTGRQLALVSASPNRAEAHLGDILMAGLRHLPPREAVLRDTDLAEALGVGAVPYKPEGDWVDYTRAGIASAAAMESRAHEVLCQVGLEQEVLMLGLDQTVTPESHPDLVHKLMTARHRLQTILKEREAETAVRTFKFDRYNNYASVAENILFGISSDPDWQEHNLGQNEIVWRLIEEQGLGEPWLRLGLAMARRLLALLDGLPADHPLFQQFEFATDDMVRSLSHLPLNKAARDTIVLLEPGQSGEVTQMTQVPDLSPEEEALVRQLPFFMTVQRHRLGLIDDSWRKGILAVRHGLHERLAGMTPCPVEAYDPAHYAEGLTVGSNILFGRIAHGQPDAEQLVKVTTRDVLDQLGAVTPIIGLALTADLARFGHRFSPAQWQRLGLARALMKRPDILILQNGLAALDPAEREKILAMLARHYPKTTVIWLAASDPEIEGFDRVGRLVNGRISGLGVEEAVDEDATETMPLTAEEQEANLLGALPLFAALDMGELRRLSIGSRQLSLAPGESLMREGQAGEAAYVILQGTMDVLKRLEPNQEPTKVDQVGRGAIVGEIALFADVPRTATLVAREPMQLLELRAEVLEQLVLENPRLGLSILRTLARRLAPAATGQAPPLTTDAGAA